MSIVADPELALDRCPAAARPADLVRRNFADRSNALWVTDLTNVATWSGAAYVCFIVDAFSRMIVAWRVATTHMRTEMVLDAVEMARWQRGTQLEGLIARSDAGLTVHLDPLRRATRRARRRRVDRSVGDSFDKPSPRRSTSSTSPS